MLKKTLGLIAILILVLVGEIVWLSQSDIQGKWMSYVEQSADRSDFAPSFGSEGDGPSWFDESSDPGTEFMGETSTVASLADAQGQVTVMRDGVTVELLPFMALMVGDVIETGADGKAEIAWTGYGRTLVAANSKLTITEAEMNASDEGIVAKLKLDAGRVWTRLEKLLSTGSSFEVKASNVVATVRGTSFGVGMDRPGRVEVKVAESNVQIARTASADSDEIIGTPVTVGAMQRMDMIEGETQLPKPLQMSSKEMEADLFLMDGNMPVPVEYLDMEWMAFVEMIINSIPPDQLPEDFNKQEFLEYMRQMQTQIPDEVKQQYMQEYQSGSYSN